jgi:hypothetical protein
MGGADDRREPAGIGGGRDRREPAGNGATRDRRPLRPAGPAEAAVGVGLVLVVVAGLAVLVAGIAGSLSFFGQGADEEFRAWTDRPLLWAGGMAVLLGAAGVTAGLVIGARTVARGAALAAAVAGLAVLAVGLVARAGRRHPQAAERRAVAALGVAPGRAVDLLTSGSEPSGTALVAGAGGQGPPVAVRSWSPATCAGLARALTPWADPGSLHVPRGFRPDSGLSCVWSATRGGYAVLAELRPAAGTREATATVVVSPPGDEL